MTKSYSLLLLLILSAGTVFAGQKHFGNGTTKGDACERANSLAEKGANAKGTCWKECKLDKCWQEKDGTWTCVAFSANHKGSCSKKDYNKI